MLLIKKKLMLHKIAKILLIVIILFNIAIPPKKADAFLQFAIPAGIELGVGAYVLGAFAVGGAAYIFGQSDTADDIFDNASKTWSGTQDAIKSAWSASVKGVMSVWDSGVDTAKSWSMPVGQGVIDTYNNARSTFYTDATISNSYKNLAVDTATITYPTTTTQGVMDLANSTSWFSGLTYKNVGLIIIDGNKKVRKFDHMYFESSGMPIFFNGTTYATRSDSAFLSFSSSTAFMSSHRWTTGDYTVTSAWGKSGQDLFDYVSKTLLVESFNYVPKASQSFTYIPKINANSTSFSIYDFALTGKSYTSVLGKDFFGDMALPKTGSDYVVKIPPIDSFIPYPKATDGTLDKTKGPLVYDPTLENYKTKTGSTVYSPDQIAWDYPKPKVKVDTATGTKTIAYDNPITGVSENVSDGTTTPDTTVPANPPFDYDTPGKVKLSTLVTTRFPFSLPWDIYRVLGVLSADPVTPVIAVDKPFMGMPFRFKVDLKFLDPYIPWFRGFEIIGFVIFLITSTRKLLGGAQ